jgi:magnesium chelatase family protein
MIAQMLTGGVQGVDAYLVRVEVSSEASNESHMNIVGLPEAAVRESQVRIRAALRALGYPSQKDSVTINLAPAHIRKSGTAYDLPMALGLLASRSVVPAESLKGRLALGEVSLDGRVRPVRGVLPVAIAARDAGLETLIVPHDNGPEAAVVEGLRVIGVRDIRDAVGALAGERDQDICVPAAPVAEQDLKATYRVNLSEVCGQERAKRALEIAAAGGHGLLMVGSPGSGKSMLARRLTTILPSMTLDERLETTKIYSVAGLLPHGQGLLSERPFRAPHHTASDVALVGGGSFPRPGEISLAHNGVLFLDELPEYRRQVLEVLRQPLEDHFVTVSRAALTVTFPAHFTLIAAMNPCPCGYANDPRHRCSCSPVEQARYRGRISGPLLDRIDLQVAVQPVPFEKLRDTRRGEPSADVQARVETARRIQSMRLTPRGLTSNSQMGSSVLRHHCRLSAEAERVFTRALEKFGLSARAHDRMLRVARTIADLDCAPDEAQMKALAQSQTLGVEHVVEALELRGFLHP